jgi:hypothetical protein
LGIKNCFYAIWPLLFISQVHEGVFHAAKVGVEVADAVSVSVKDYYQAATQGDTDAALPHFSDRLAAVAQACFGR